MTVPQVHFILGAALAWGGELDHAAQAFGVATRLARDADAWDRARAVGGR